MDFDMEPEILQARNVACQHHGQDHLYSSIDNRVEYFFGHFREEFQGDLSAQNLGSKIEYYGTFLPTDQLMESPSSNSANEIPNSADMETRIEKLFGHFRQNFHEDNLGPQFSDYGTFLSAQLSDSQASNAVTENDSSNSVRPESLLAVAHKPAEPVGTKKYVMLNDINKMRITDKMRAIRTKRPRTSGCHGSQQFSMSAGSSRVHGNLKEGCTATSTLETTSLLLTEARNFKHRADRLKKGGQETLSNKLYLEAVLKFLQVASLWEHKRGNRKHDAIQLLLETAELSKRCASECCDMQATVLLYEAMELANKRAALLEGHPETDGANHRYEVHEFVIRARQARFM